MQNNYFRHIASLFHQIHLGLILAGKAFLIGLFLTIYRWLKTRHPTNKFAFLKEFGFGPITALPKPFIGFGVPLNKVINQPSLTTTLQICNSPTRKRKTHPWLCSLRLKKHHTITQIYLNQIKYRKNLAQNYKNTRVFSQNNLLGNLFRHPFIA